MRVLVAAATIAACVAVSFIAQNGVKPSSLLASESFAAGLRTPIGKQTNPPKPGAGAGGGNDSCQWAHDNECDDPDIGTGACRQGTDYSDCRAIRAGDD